jgi:hypothetical protein
VLIQGGGGGGGGLMHGRSFGLVIKKSVSQKQENKHVLITRFD